MSFLFSKHYTVEEARALLPRVREWFEQLDHLQAELSKLNLRLNSLSSSGNDVGGNTVNSAIKAQARVQEIAQEFASRSIQIKDLERGLVDFPALRDGKEIFLCWEKGESDIEHWHEIDAGFAGREPLD